MKKECFKFQPDQNGLKRVAKESMAMLWTSLDWWCPWEIIWCEAASSSSGPPKASVRLVEHVCDLTAIPESFADGALRVVSSFHKMDSSSFMLEPCSNFCKSYACRCTCDFKQFDLTCSDSDGVWQIHHGLKMIWLHMFECWPMRIKALMTSCYKDLDQCCTMHCQHPESIGWDPWHKGNFFSKTMEPTSFVSHWWEVPLLWMLYPLLRMMLPETKEELLLQTWQELMSRMFDTCTWLCCRFSSFGNQWPCSSGKTRRQPRVPSLQPLADLHDEPFRESDNVPGVPEGAELVGHGDGDVVSVMFVFLWF